MFNFFRIFFLALYCLCFLSAFAAFYCGVFLYQHGGEMTQIALWVGGGIVLTILAILLYRVYRKLAGR